MRRRLLLFIAILAALMPQQAAAVSTSALVTISRPYAPNEEIPLIVTLRDTPGVAVHALDDRGLAARHRAVTAQVSGFRLRNSGIWRQVHREFNVFPMLAVTVLGRDVQRLAALPEVISVEEDVAHAPALDESSELIHSRAASAGGYGGSGSTVAVLDTGVAANHPFLAGKVIAEACFSTSSNDGIFMVSLCPGGANSATGAGAAAPCATLCDHGTHVAGIIAGKELCLDCSTDAQVQLAGVAPGANVIAVQVFTRFNSDRSCGGVGTAPCVQAMTSDILAGLQWIFNNRNTPGWGQLVAVNMSLGDTGRNTTYCDATNGTYSTWISSLRAVGIASVVSSGNSGFTNAVGTPACIRTAISVGSTRTRRVDNVVPGSTYALAQQDTISGFSNTPASNANGADPNGNRLLDLLAPGSNIYSSIATGNGYGVMSGTSMAAPHVAGAFAVLKAINPDLTVSQAVAILQRTGVAVTHSNGLVLQRIDLAAAIAAVKNTNVETELSQYAVDFGLTTRNDTVYRRVGIQSRALRHQSLDIAVLGSGFALEETSCTNYLDDQIPTCGVMVSFHPTSARDRQLLEGTLTFTVDGVPMVVGLTGRNALTTPDVGLTATRFAGSRTSTRTATRAPTRAPLGATLIAAATRTQGAVFTIATGVALAGTQFVLDDRSSATAERVNGSPSRTATGTRTRTMTATPIAIVLTVGHLQTATRAASSSGTQTRVAAASQTAIAVTQDRMTATAERVLGSPTRTALPSATPTPSRTRTLSTSQTATATHTPAAGVLGHTAVATSTVAAIVALPKQNGYALIEHGSGTADPALVLLERDLSVQRRTTVAGESADSMAYDQEHDTVIVGGRLYERALVLQRYDVSGVLRGSRLEAGTGTVTALHAADGYLFAGLRYRPIIGAAERYELRAYDITSPRDLAPIAGMTMVLPGPAAQIVAIPGSPQLMVVGQSGAAAGYAAVIQPKAAATVLQSRIAWAKPLVGAAVLLQVIDGQPNYTAFVSDRTAVSSLALQQSTGMLNPVAVQKRFDAADSLRADATGTQVIAAVYNNPVDGLRVTVYDTDGSRLVSSGKGYALPGDGGAAALDAQLGQVVVGAGTIVSAVSFGAALGATPTAAPTGTSTTTPTMSATPSPTRTRTLSPTTTPTATGIADQRNTINSGMTHTCALKPSGSVVCWGDSAYGQTGAGVLAAQTTPRPVTLGVSAAVRQLAGAWDHHCARLSDGSVVCWGDDSYGELGDGTTGTTAVAPVTASTGGASTHIAIGWHHACSITADRTVVCWGYNSNGQLGNRSTVDATAPQVAFDVSGATQLALGATHSCALVSGGGVYCWGGNSSGQLGQGNVDTYTGAVKVPLTGVVSLSAFNNHTCALTSAKNVYCWGANTYGQAGGTVMTVPVKSPLQVKKSATTVLGNIVGIEVSYGHSCASDTAGAMYCWGDNFYGQLAKDISSVFSSPYALPVGGLVATSGERVVEMGLGEKHSCALLANDSVKCWGNNQYGQLGSGALGTSVVTTPGAVVGW